MKWEFVSLSLNRSGKKITGFLPHSRLKQLMNWRNIPSKIIQAETKSVEEIKLV